MATALKNQFSEYGYNLVALPKCGIAPLQLLYKSGTNVTSAESKLTMLFPVDETQPPAISADVDVLPIVGSAEASYDAKAGINFLQGLLQKLNMGKAAAKMKINDHDTLTFSFRDIKENSIDLVSLDNFISNTPPEIKNFNSFGKKLKDSELYVVTSVLKSTSFSIKITDKNGQAIDAAASLKGMVDANVKFERGKNNAVTLTHNDKQIALVFAFKGQRIIYDKPSFWSGGNGSFRIVEAEDMTLRNNGDLKTEPLLLGLIAPDI